MHKIIAKKTANLVFLGGMLFFGVACSSGEVALPISRGDGDSIGRARGEACGAKVVSTPGYLALDFFPLMFNDRLERAINAAIASVPGATALRNIEIEETWFYFLLGMTRCVIVTGEAVR